MFCGLLDGVVSHRVQVMSRSALLTGADSLTLNVSPVRPHTEEKGAKKTVLAQSDSP